MAEDWSVRAEGLSKKFGASLKASMRYGLVDSLKQLSGQRVDGAQLREGEFWAVKDVSFELKRGDSLGIMGVNGSGKSTLLRLLTGVYRPDLGRVALRGVTGALIAAGAGFAPMLTGRENIFVNGALLGMKRAEIERRVDEIIAFAELEGFLDMPVRNYSSGMVVRLGFAIAAMSEPDVLIVDEVLAVGDINFQKKCYDYLFRLKRNGTTIILVSHSIGAIWAVCNTGLFVDKGAVIVAGDVQDVIRAYEDYNARAAALSMEKVEALGERAGVDSAPSLPSSGADAPVHGDLFGAACRNIQLQRLDGTPVDEFGFGESFLISAEVDLAKPFRDFILRFVLDAAHYRNICTIDSYEQGAVMEQIEPGRYRFLVKIHAPNLRPGSYVLNVAIVSKTVGIHLFLQNRAKSFVVTHPKDRFFYSDPTAVVHLEAAFNYERRI